MTEVTICKNCKHMLYWSWFDKIAGDCDGAYCGISGVVDFVTGKQRNRMCINVNPHGNCEKYEAKEKARHKKDVRVEGRAGSGM